MSIFLRLVEDDEELEEDERYAELFRGDTKETIAALRQRGYSLDEASWLIVDALKHYYR